MKKVFTVAGLLLLVVFVMAGCAPGMNELVSPRTATSNTAGFWLGLWHGVISPVTFIISLFTRSVGMYEVHNNGGWYNFGFLLGLSIILGGGGAGGAARRRSRR
jgi:hypothetical protein